MAAKETLTTETLTTETLKTKKFELINRRNSLNSSLTDEWMDNPSENDKITLSLIECVDTEITSVVHALKESTTNTANTNQNGVKTMTTEFTATEIIETLALNFNISIDDAERVLSALSTYDEIAMPEFGGTIDNGDANKLAGHNGYQVGWNDGADSNAIVATNGDAVYIPMDSEEFAELIDDDRSISELAARYSFS